jgi:hypothetical protein
MALSLSILVENVSKVSVVGLFPQPTIAISETKSDHRRFVHSVFQTRGDYTLTRAPQCANVVWSDLEGSENAVIVP